MPDAVTDLAACPECAVRVPVGQIEAHLRRTHHIYRFRGARRSLNDTLATLLSLVPRPDDVAEAWPVLEAIVSEEYSDRAEAFLAPAVGMALARARAGEAILEAAARAMAGGALTPRLLAALAGESEVLPRHLAMRVLGHFSQPLSAAAVGALRPMLSDRRWPLEIALGAAAGLIQATGKEGPAAAKVYQALIAGWGRSGGVERLSALEGRVGPSATLTAMRQHLEDRQMLSCPRCGIELPRRKMADHLWARHELVLDGPRVREPWHALAEWVKELPEGEDWKATEVFARCQALAQKVDPKWGLYRLYRLVLSRGLNDDQIRQVFLADAAARGASLCPHCYAWVPAPAKTPPRALNVYRGRISAFGYRVEVADRTLMTSLEIETPRGLIRRGPEPRRRLTARGATILLVGPPVLLALGLSFGTLAPALPPLIPVALLLACAGVATWAVHFAWRQRIPPLERAVDYAWRLLVPQLHENGFSLEDSAFAAALAWTSLKHGQRPPRQAELHRLLRLTEQAIVAGHGVMEHLADLRRLAIEDAQVGGADPVPLVVVEVGRALDGRMSVGYAERLLAGWESPWWTGTQLSRLRILMCDRAFEAGFEVANLIELSQAAPTLGAVLEVDDVEGLLNLRLLWSMRARSQWDRGKPALTVFDVAADPVASRRHLDRYSDLLLVYEPEGWPTKLEGEKKPMIVCGRGVAIQDVVLDHLPQMIEVQELRSGFLLLLDGEEIRLRDDPQDLTDRLERWLKFFFHEFRPQAASVRRWRPPNDTVTLRALAMVPCPECGRPVRPHTGQVGVALAVS